MYLSSDFFLQWKIMYIAPVAQVYEKRSFEFDWRGLIFAVFYFAGIFFLRELILADRGQSAKIRTRKIFMLHGIL